MSLRPNYKPAVLDSLKDAVSNWRGAPRRPPHWFYLDHILYQSKLRWEQTERDLVSDYDREWEFINTVFEKVLFGWSVERGVKKLWLQAFHDYSVKHRSNVRKAYERYLSACQRSGEMPVPWPFDTTSQPEDKATTKIKDSNQVDNNTLPVSVSSVPTQDTNVSASNSSGVPATQTNTAAEAIDLTAITSLSETMTQADTRLDQVIKLIMNHREYMQDHAVKVQIFEKSYEEAPVLIRKLKGQVEELRKRENQMQQILTGSTCTEDNNDSAGKDDEPSAKRMKV